jgi:excinuclease ABC subunit C
MSDVSIFDHKAFLKNLTTQPGVYRMYNQNEEVIYVGKAKNLKNRVTS